MNRTSLDSRSSYLTIPNNEIIINNKTSTRSKINEFLNEIQSYCRQRTHKEIENYAKQISNILENDPTFNELQLAGSFIQNEAALIIFKGLENNKTVTSLDLT